MTSTERDILAVALALNTVFMILLLPNIVPIDYSNDTRGLIVTMLVWGLPLGAVGVWVNHRFGHAGRSGNDTPPRRK